VRQFNEKPSSVPNLGQDIKGAARHHRDTYETPEELRAKAQRKQVSGDAKRLEAEFKAKFALALNESTERGQDVLKEYELRKGQLGLGTEFSDTNQFRAAVMNETDRTKREVLRKKFNATINKINKIRYIRPIELPRYFEPKTKNQFREVNGREVTWQTENKSFDVDFLKSSVASVQYGNSLSDSERVYVSENLVESIKILQKYFKPEFLKGLGFSYGARGKAGSIAHYQDSLKVLAFNRGWDGALIHELGHAIDYHLGLASWKITWEMKKRYEAKLKTNEFLWSQKKYYMKPVEIFARMFEAWVYSNMPERTEFMIFINGGTAIPDLGPEETEFMNEVLKEVLK